MRQRAIADVRREQRAQNDSKHPSIGGRAAIASLLCRSQDPAQAGSARVADCVYDHSTERTMKVSKKISKRLTAGSIIAAMAAAGIMLTDGAHARDLRTTSPMLGPSIPLLQSTADLAKSATPHAPPYPVSATAAGPKCWPCKEVPQPDNVTAFYAPGDSTVPRQQHFHPLCPSNRDKSCLYHSGQ